MKILQRGGIGLQRAVQAVEDRQQSTAARQPARSRDNPAAPWRCACESCRTRPADVPARSRKAARSVRAFSSSACISLTGLSTVAEASSFPSTGNSRSTSSSASELPFVFLNAISIPELSQMFRAALPGVGGARLQECNNFMPQRRGVPKATLTTSTRSTNDRTCARCTTLR